MEKSDYIAVFCACPEDKTAERVSKELRAAGWRRAFAVKGGWDALVESDFEVLNRSVD
jgi:hypothetical protein